MYAISTVEDLRVGSTPFHTVATLADAETFLAEKFEVLMFDLDEENDAADVIVKIKGTRCVNQMQVVRV